MVLRVPPQPEDDMLNAANGLDFPKSTLLRLEAFGPGADLWVCPLRASPGKGYWIGSLPPPDRVELHAYLALVPRQLESLPVFEARKGWTDPKWRRKGLGRELLRAAMCASPIMSDFDGMTQMAYDQWTSMPGANLRWWDVVDEMFVEESAIPALQKFDAYAPAERWQMVLSQ